MVAALAGRRGGFIGRHGVRRDRGGGRALSAAAGVDESAAGVVSLAVEDDDGDEEESLAAVLAAAAAVLVVDADGSPLADRAGPGRGDHAGAAEVSPPPAAGRFCPEPGQC